MDTYITILIIIFVILSFYLGYKFIEDYKTLENFSTQSSLSTYFQNTVDSDVYMTNNNIFGGQNNAKIINNQTWNGIWQNNTIPINAQFFQVNDKIIVAMTNSNFSELLQQINEPIQSTTSCNNMYLGIGQLNVNKNSFYIINTICNTFNNLTLGIGSNTSSSSQTSYFSGLLDDNTIILTSNNSSNPGTINLTLTQYFTNAISYSMFPYIYQFENKIAPFVTQSVSTISSNYKYTFNCPTGTNLCQNTNTGLTTTNYSGINGNACGQFDTSDSNICNNNVTCLINPTSENVSSTIPNCNIYPEVNKFINNMINSSNLNLCNYLTNFSSTNCNAVILCYVSNIGNVQTLNYQYFGPMSNESSLTTQYDMMNNILNNNSSTNLPKYRNIISTTGQLTSTTNLSPTMNALSFTNCLTNTYNIGITNNLISNCLNNSINYVSNYIPSNSNNNLIPALWNINVDNTTNSCGFTLSTFNQYNSVVKHVNYDNKTLNLSIYGGGLGQKLYFDSSNVLTNTTNPSFIAITANIRTNNGLYLIPNSSIGGLSNNSNIVTLQSSPEQNSKWLILGMSLNSLNNLSSVLNTISF